MTSLIEKKLQINKTLNKKLFGEDNKLKPDVLEALLNIADEFVNSLRESEIPIVVIDYWFLGSNAAYNYTDTSDIDLHIIANTEEVSSDPKILKLLYDFYKNYFNNKYDITVKGHQVEVYVEDIKVTAVSNGVYSLKKNDWIKFPKKTEPMDIDVEDNPHYKELVKKALALKPEDIENFINNLYIERNISLVQDGEFGIGNLIFKEFRSNGLLDKLKTKKAELKSNELTLENFSKFSLENNYIIDFDVLYTGD